jgi:hypothetical protein
MDKMELDAAAPFLFSQETIESLTDLERRGVYTLERLRKARPEVIPEVIRLRGQHMGVLRIAKIVKMGHETVSAICCEYPEEVAAAQQKRVSRLLSASDKLVELVDRDPESVPPNVRCLAASQLLDKAQLLSGAATQRIEEVQTVDIYAHWQRFLKGEEGSLVDGKFLPVIEAEVKGNETQDPIVITCPNTPLETGFNGQKKSPITGSPAAAGALALPSSQAEGRS